MALTTDEVRKIAALARLRFTPEEEARLVSQLGRIVDYIDQLQAYDVPPTETGQSGVREADDRALPCLPREAFLANAPATLGNFLLVPEIKGGGDYGA
jgi:aspartyl-tRNA(Asn)/glutamyl-tRNA(Gln) amidotransferase subunit C